MSEAPNPAPRNGFGRNTGFGYSSRTGSELPGRELGIFAICLDHLALGLLLRLQILLHGFLLLFRRFARGAALGRNSGPCLRGSLNRATDSQNAEQDQDIDTQSFHNVSGITALALILTSGGEAPSHLPTFEQTQGPNENLDLDSST